jgi:hypothetical protein
LSTTISTGFRFQYSSGQKPLGGKELESTVGFGLEAHDVVTLNNPKQGVRLTEPAQAAEVPVQRSQASQYKDVTKRLARSGRLYVRDEGVLRRADPMEIKERLDQGLAVEVVTRHGQTSSASGYYQSNVSSKERVFYSGYHFADSSSSNSRSEVVNYSSSPITKWESLDWADEEARGVTGVSQLPASGGRVVVCESFESEWNRRTHEQWGVFSIKERNGSSGGYIRSQTD